MRHATRPEEASAPAFGCEQPPRAKAQAASVTLFLIGLRVLSRRLAAADESPAFIKSTPTPPAPFGKANSTTQQSHSTSALTPPHHIPTIQPARGLDARTSTHSETPAPPRPTHTSGAPPQPLRNTRRSQADRRRSAVDPAHAPTHRNPPPLRQTPTPPGKATANQATSLTLDHPSFPAPLPRPSAISHLPSAIANRQSVTRNSHPVSPGSSRSCGVGSFLAVGSVSRSASPVPLTCVNTVFLLQRYVAP